jgi:cyclic pyranopterin phosphate synthase
MTRRKHDGSDPQQRQQQHLQSLQDDAGLLRTDTGPLQTDAGDRPLTHVDASGAASMVDVGGKPVTARTAVATGEIRMHAQTLEAIRNNTLRKGDVLTVAKIAGIQAAKRTADLIPLCHTLPLTHVDVTLVLDNTTATPCVRARATVSTVAQTGVEMEAITAVAVALVTVYDMAKAIDRNMVIGEIRVESKTGGRSSDRP